MKNLYAWNLCMKLG